MADNKDTKAKEQSVEDKYIEKLSSLSAENQKLKDVISANSEKRRARKDVPKITGLKGLKGFIS